MNLQRKLLVFFTWVLLITMVFAPAGAQGAIESWNKGVHILSRSGGDYASDTFKQSLDNLRDTHANSVSLIVEYSQADKTANAVQKYFKSPTDAALIEGIGYAHSLDMAVNLAITMRAQDNTPPMELSPSDPDAWFSSYQAVILKYARMAEQNGVESMVIGSQLFRLSADDLDANNTARWRGLIQAVRAVYSGSLTYSASWRSPIGGAAEKDRIVFWDDLDMIGLAAYFPLQTENTNQPGALEGLWRVIDETQIRPLHLAFDKPVVFTDIGYRSTSNAQNLPEFTGTVNSVFDEQRQADLYRGAYSYWKDIPYMNGLVWWNWKSDPARGGAGDTDFTPQHKLAEKVMTEWNVFSSTPPTGEPPVEQPPAEEPPIIEPPVEQPPVEEPPIEEPPAEEPETPTSTPPVETPTSTPPIESPTPPIETPTSTDPGTDIPSDAPQPLASANWIIQGGDVVIDVVVWNAGANVDDMIVDIEAQNGGQKIGQWFDEGVDLAGGEGKRYQIRVPQSELANWFEIHVGFFASGWQSLYAWIAAPALADEPENLTIVGTGLFGNATGETVDSSGDVVGIVWPEENAIATELHRLEAYLQNWKVRDYAMFWQVDGDRYNSMENAWDGSPRKQAWIDVSSWRWNADGNYLLRFIAQNFTGQEIGSASVNMIVE